VSPSPPPRPLAPRAGWRLPAAFGTVLGALAFVAAVFWFQDLRYALPTPRPADLVALELGARVSSEELARLGVPRERPLFLHFASSDCPCSRFVAEHLRTLARSHGESVRFLAVDVGADEDGLGLDLDELADPAGELAARLGVYSTPQAVLIGADERLHYRGNYQSGRYCNDPSSEYARLALEALAAGRASPAWPEAALRAYGCALPARSAE